MLFKIKFKSINPSFYRMNIDHNLLRENKNIGRYSINQYLKSAGFITRKMHTYFEVNILLVFLRLDWNLFILQYII